MSQRINPERRMTPLGTVSDPKGLRDPADVQALWEAVFQFDGQWLVLEDDPTAEHGVKATWRSRRDDEPMLTELHSAMRRTARGRFGLKKVWTNLAYAHLVWEFDNTVRHYVDKRMSDYLEQKERQHVAKLLDF